MTTELGPHAAEPSMETRVARAASMKSLYSSLFGSTTYRVIESAVGSMSAGLARRAASEPLDLSCVRRAAEGMIRASRPFSHLSSTASNYDRQTAVLSALTALSLAAKCPPATRDGLPEPEVVCLMSLLLDAYGWPAVDRSIALMMIIHDAGQTSELDPATRQSHRREDHVQ